MIGKIKILESSKKEILRPKLSADNVQLHFSSLHEHRLTINDKKNFIVSINSVTIEADSLLIIANVRKEDETVSGFSNFSDVEFRFYPKI
jgi:hypothetical protein